MVDRSPRPTDLKLEKTSDSQSQTQRCNIQEINEDNHDQTRKIYHFENCSTVYIDSLNAHDVRMENCGNNVSKVTCTLFFFFSFFPHFCSRLTWPYNIIQITVLGFLVVRTFYTHNLMQSPMVCGL